MVFPGERLTDSDVDQIFKHTGTEEDLDGNIKYEGNEGSAPFHSTKIVTAKHNMYTTNDETNIEKAEDKLHEADAIFSNLLKDYHCLIAVQIRPENNFTFPQGLTMANIL